MPQVSLIVVNYNGMKCIIDCLRGIEEQSFKNLEVIVVDNASSDHYLCEIQKFLEVNGLGSSKLIPLNTNMGFSGGNLEGLKHANGEYIALLNNDTEPDERWLEELVVAMDSNPKVGICASKLIIDGTDIIDSAGDGISAALRGFKRGEGENYLRHNQKRYVFGACAGAALYRREMIDEIGFLDEDFFLIHEDTDLNFRAQLHGWKVLYVPTAVVHHKVRASIGSMSDTAIYYTLRNSEFVRIKNVPLGVFLRCFPEFILGIVTEFIYFAIKHGQFVLYLKAKIDAIKMLPKMLKKRSLTMKNRKVSNQDLLTLMTPILRKDFLRTKVKKFLYG